MYRIITQSSVNTRRTWFTDCIIGPDSTLKGRHIALKGRDIALKGCHTYRGLRSRRVNLKVPIISPSHWLPRYRVYGVDGHRYHPSVCNDVGILGGSKIEGNMWSFIQYYIFCLFILCHLIIFVLSLFIHLILSHDYSEGCVNYFKADPPQRHD